LLTVLGFVLGGVIGMFYLVRRHVRSQQWADQMLEAEQEVWPQKLSRFTFLPYHPLQARRPARWLAIRSRDTHAVQLALGLHNPRPCSWSEGLFSSRNLFIAPPVNGWTLVFGAGLPLPDDDVDACYRFLRELSRKLGHVQFFQADQVVQHHAWAQVESGRVVRAYAWAGATLWNQGVKTSAEIALRMNCFAYGENPGRDDWVVADHLVANVEKVAQLAQRWSLDPAEIDGRVLAQQQGIAGNVAGR
jgi:hypothetical protein